MRLAVIFSLIFTLSACGGSSSDGDRTTASIDKLVGVWDATEVDPEEGEDVTYLVIDSEGLVSIYDYAGDEYDDAGNCYWVVRDVAGLEATGDNHYDFTWFSQNETYPVIITVSGNTLKMYDEGESSADAWVLTKSTLRESDLIPECNDFLAADANPLVKAKSAAKVQSFKPKAH